TRCPRRGQGILNRGPPAPRGGTGRAGSSFPPPAADLMANGPGPSRVGGAIRPEPAPGRIGRPDRPARRRSGERRDDPIHGPIAAVEPSAPDARGAGSAAPAPATPSARLACDRAFPLL